MREQIFKDSRQYMDQESRSSPWNAHPLHLPKEYSLISRRRKICLSLNFRRRFPLGKSAQLCLYQSSKVLYLLSRVPLTVLNILKNIL